MSADPIGLDDLRTQVLSLDSGLTYFGDQQFASPESTSHHHHHQPQRPATASSDVNVLVLDNSSNPPTERNHHQSAAAGLLGLPPRPVRVGSTSSNGSKPPKAPQQQQQQHHHHHHHHQQHHYQQQQQQQQFHSNQTASAGDYPPFQQQQQQQHQHMLMMMMLQQQQQQQHHILNPDAQLIFNMSSTLRQLYTELGLLRPDCPTGEMGRRNRWLMLGTQLVAFFQSASPVMEPAEWERHQRAARQLQAELERTKRRKAMTLDVCRAVEAREHSLRDLHEVVVRADQALYGATAARKTLSRNSAPQIAREAEVAAAEVKSCTIQVLHRLVAWSKAIGSKVVIRQHEELAALNNNNSGGGGGGGGSGSVRHQFSSSSAAAPASLLFVAELSDSASDEEQDDNGGDEENGQEKHHASSTLKQQQQQLHALVNLNLAASSPAPPNVVSTAPNSPAASMMMMMMMSMKNNNSDSTKASSSQQARRNQALELLCETFTFRGVPYLEKVRRDSAFVHQTASLQCVLSVEMLMAFKNFATVQQQQQQQQASNVEQQIVDVHNGASPAVSHISIMQQQSSPVTVATTTTTTTTIKTTTMVREATMKKKMMTIAASVGSANKSNNSSSNSSKLRQATRNRLPNELPLSNSPKASAVGASGETLMRLFTSSVVPAGTLIQRGNHAQHHHECSISSSFSPHHHHHQDHPDHHDHTRKKANTTLFRSKFSVGEKPCCAFLDEWEYPDDTRGNHHNSHQASSSSVSRSRSASCEHTLDHNAAAAAAAAVEAGPDTRPKTRRGSKNVNSVTGTMHMPGAGEQLLLPQEDKAPPTSSARHRDVHNITSSSSNNKNSAEGATASSSQRGNHGEKLRAEIRQQQREAKRIQRSHMITKIRETVAAAADAKPLSPVPHSALPHLASRADYSLQTVCVGGLGAVLNLPNNNYYSRSSNNYINNADGGRNSPASTVAAAATEDLFWNEQQQQQQQHRGHHHPSSPQQPRNKKSRHGEGNDDDDDDDEHQAFGIHVVRTSGDGRPWSADDVLHGSDIGAQTHHRLMTPPPTAQRMRFTSPLSGTPSPNNKSSGGGSAAAAAAAAHSSFSSSGIQRQQQRGSSASSSSVGGGSSSLIIIAGSSARGVQAISAADEVLFRGGRAGAGVNGLSVIESVHTSPPAATTYYSNNNNNNSNNNHSLNHSLNNSGGALNNSADASTLFGSSGAAGNKGVLRCVDSDGLEFAGRPDQAPSAVRGKALKQTAMCALTLMDENIERRRQQQQLIDTSMSNNNNPLSSSSAASVASPTPAQKTRFLAAASPSPAASGSNRSHNINSNNNNNNNSSFLTSQHRQSPPPSKMHSIVAAEQRERREYQRAQHDAAMMRMKHPAFRRNAYSSRHARNAKGPAEYWSSVVVFYVVIKLLARRALGRARRRLAGRKIAYWYRRVSRMRPVVSLLSDRAWRALIAVRTRHATWTASIHLHSAFDHAFAIAHMRAFYIQKAFYRYRLRKKFYLTVQRVVAGLRIQRFIRLQFQVVYKMRGSLRRRYSAKKIQRFFRVFRVWSNPLLRMPVTRGQQESDVTYKRRMMQATNMHLRSKLAAISRYDKKADKMEYIPFAGPDMFVEQFKLGFEFSTGITWRLRNMRVHLDGRVARKSNVAVRMIQRFILGAKANNRFRAIKLHIEIDRFYKSIVLRRRMKPAAAIQPHLWAYFSARFVAARKQVVEAALVLQRVGKFFPEVKKRMSEKARSEADVKEMMELFAISREQEHAATKIQHWFRVVRVKRAALRIVKAAREKRKGLLLLSPSSSPSSSQQQQRNRPEDNERDYAALRIQTHWRMFALRRVWIVAQRAWRFVEKEWSEMFVFATPVMRVQSKFRAVVARQREMARHKQRRAQSEAVKVMQSVWATSSTRSLNDQSLFLDDGDDDDDDFFSA